VVCIQKDAAVGSAVVNIVLARNFLHSSQVGKPKKAQRFHNSSADIRAIDYAD